MNPDKRVNVNYCYMKIVPQKRPIAAFGCINRPVDEPQ